MFNLLTVWFVQTMGVMGAVDQQDNAEATSSHRLSSLHITQTSAAAETHAHIET